MKRGPKDQPAHQAAKLETIHKCRSTIAANATCKPKSWRVRIANTKPLNANRRIGENTNNPRAGLIRLTAIPSQSGRPPVTRLGA